MTEEDQDRMQQARRDEISSVKQKLWLTPKTPTGGGNLSA